MGILAALLAAGWTAPVLADLKSGHAAWDQGDYATAVREWRELADQGNADAQFNMAQAYRLGRGLERDPAQAEALLAKAAAQGHLRAIDTYGLLLFQNGKREQSMPYVTAAAERGNPRAQYLLGIAHFNGDLAEKNWVRAYALMTLANTAGFEPARAGIAQMDDFIPLEERQEAQLVAQSLKREADGKLATQLAAKDLGVDTAPVASPAERMPANVPPDVAAPDRTPPQVMERIDVTPSILAAEAAIAAAARVTGTENPAIAGADFAQGGITQSATANVAPTPVTPTPVTPTPVTPTPVTAVTETSRPVQVRPDRPQRAVAAPTADGPWRVQLGAFSVKSNADRLWSRLSANTALAGKSKFLVPAGSVTRLQVGGFASRASAQDACDALKRGRRDCLVTKP